MSHVATIKTEFKNKNILKKALKDLGISVREGKHTVKTYSEEINCEMSFQLPGWRYPVAVLDKELKFDSFNGAWGNIEELYKVQREYAKDMALKEAEDNGFSVEGIQNTQDGGIELYLTI